MVSSVLWSCLARRLSDDFGVIFLPRKSGGASRLRLCPGRDRIRDDTGEESSSLMCSEPTECSTMTGELEWKLWRPLGGKGVFLGVGRPWARSCIIQSISSFSRLNRPPISVVPVQASRSIRSIICVLLTFFTCLLTACTKPCDRCTSVSTLRTCWRRPSIFSWTLFQMASRPFAEGCRGLCGVVVG